MIILHVFQWTEVALIAYIGPTYSKFCPQGTLEQQPTTGIGGFDTKKSAISPFSCVGNMEEGDRTISFFFGEKDTSAKRE